jgi:predicted nuclease with RNAse H fold
MASTLNSGEVAGIHTRYVSCQSVNREVPRFAGCPDSRAESRRSWVRRRAGRHGGEGERTPRPRCRTPGPVTRESIPTYTLGIDLASQPKETGVCLIDWSAGAGEVIDLQSGELTDDALVDLMLDERVAKVGIDAPFGWPVAFIDAVTSYRDEGRWIDLEANELRFRATEIRIFEETNQWPLSVAVGDLAWPAMRAARLLSRVVASEDAQRRRPARGMPLMLDRSGAGLVVEVYPMAALRRWQLIPAGGAAAWSYKGDKPGRRDRRADYLKAIRTQLTIRMSADHVECCVEDDDEFDALISALIARAAQTGATDPIPQGMRWLAMREGWIHLPAPTR